VIWDARLVHQGYTHFPEGCPGGPPPTRKPPTFHPTRVVPLLFAPAAVADWSAHLAEHGYAVLHGLVPPAAVREACRLLLGDIQAMQADPDPTAAHFPKALDAVTERHLPNHENSGLRHRGLPHGEFAWFLRAQPALRSVWAALYRDELAPPPAGGGGGGSGGGATVCSAPPNSAGRKLSPPPPSSALATTLCCLHA
jgi:hypothetical protein